MGGGLAMAIAADYPQLVKKIIVVDGLPCMVALSDPEFQQKEHVDCNASINRIASLSDAQFRQMQESTMPWLVADKSKIDMIVNWSMLSDRKTFAQMYYDFSNTDLREKITQITCPTLVLLESDFKRIKPAIESQFKKLKTADLRYADKGLHFIMYDDPEWYFAQLEEFIAKN